MNSGTFFINEFGRIRSGWRVAIFATLFMFSFLLTSIPLFFFSLSVGADSGATPPPVLFVDSITSLALTILMGWLCVKYLEGLPFRSLGCWFSAGWLKHL